MISLQAVLEAGEEVQDFCLQQRWRFCFIGGVALQRWGEPRLTQDADLTLLKGQLEALARLDDLVAKVKRRLQAKL